MTVLQLEYNHLEIAAILSRCKVLIGTRLHSVILSLRYGTPAVALYYEHKSKGTLDKMELSDYSFMINEIASDRMTQTLDFILNNEQDVNIKCAAAVQREQTKAIAMIEEIIKEIEA